KEPVVIDFDGIDQRIVALPVPPGNYSQLRTGTAGQLYYLETPPTPPRENSPRGSTLKHFDLSKRKTNTITEGVNSFRVTADGKKALVSTLPEGLAIVTLPSATGGLSASDGQALADKPPVPPGAESATPTPRKRNLKLDAVEVRVVPRAEWPQIFA